MPVKVTPITDVPSLLTDIYCRKCERLHHPKDPCDFSPETVVVRQKSKFIYRDNNAHRVVCEIEARNLEEADEEYMRQFVQNPAESPHISVSVEEIGKGSFLVL